MLEVCVSWSLCLAKDLIAAIDLTDKCGVGIGNVEIAGWKSGPQGVSTQDIIKPRLGEVVQLVLAVMF